MLPIRTIMDQHGMQLILDTNEEYPQCVQEGVEQLLFEEQLRFEQFQFKEQLRDTRHSGMLHTLTITGHSGMRSTLGIEDADSKGVVVVVACVRL